MPRHSYEIKHRCSRLSLASSIEAHARSTSVSPPICLDYLLRSTYPCPAHRHEHIVASQLYEAAMIAVFSGEKAPEARSARAAPRPLYTNPFLPALPSNSLLSFSTTSAQGSKKGYTYPLLVAPVRHIASVCARSFESPLL